MKSILITMALLAAAAGQGRAAWEVAVPPTAEPFDLPAGWPMDASWTDVMLSPDMFADRQAALAAATSRVESATEMVRLQKSMVDSGLAPKADLVKAEEDLSAARAELAKIKAEEGRRRSLTIRFPGLSMARGALSKPVDVELSQATVRQAAEALAKASGVEIAVGEGVPKDVRVTVQARRMPLSSVLESIAKPTGLMIAPKDDGVLLDMWPSLTVNGVETSRKTGRMAPWSDEWVVPPTALSRIPVDLSGLPRVIENAMAAVPGPGLRGRDPNASMQGRSVTVNGDTVVVSETARNEKGEAGMWITVYRMTGGKLEPAGSTFHPFQGSVADGSSPVRPPDL